MQRIVHAAAVEQRSIKPTQCPNRVAGVLGLDRELMPARGRRHGPDPQRGLFLFSRFKDPLRIRVRDDPRLAQPAEVSSPIEMPALGTEARLGLVLP